MHKNSKKALSGIMSYLKGGRLADLPFEKACSYIVYRIGELIRNSKAVSYNEIKYNLCETGPGKRRVDPLLLNIVLDSKRFGEISLFKRLKFGGIDFYSYDDFSQESIRSIVELKARVVQRTNRLAGSGEAQEIIAKLIKEIARHNHFDCLSLNKSIDSGFVEGKLESNHNDKKLFIQQCNSGS